MNNKENNKSSNVVPTRWNHILAKNLQKRMTKFGFNSVQLAKLIHVDDGTVRNWLKGLNVPKGDSAVLLSEVLECSMDWLFKGEGPEPDSPERDPIYKVEKQDNLNIAAQESQYDLLGGWKPRQVGEDYVYAGKVLEILSQNNAYSRALKANIDSFYAAIQAEKELFETYKTLQNQSKLIQQLEDRIAALEKKTAAGE